MANPSWRRENDADVYGAVLEGTLPSVATINYEFVQPDIFEVPTKKKAGVATA